MIFVAVRQFRDVAAAEVDVQFAANTIWKSLIEEAIEAGEAEITAIVRWLSEKPRGDFRPWVEIMRREPTLATHQRITGNAGFRFSDLGDATNFAEAFGMPF